MQKIVIAIDSFKGSLSTFDAGKAVACAAREVFGNVRTVISPVADGGEGTVEAVVYANNGKTEKVVVSDPLGRRIEAAYGIIPDTKTAIVEMSAAAGLPLVSESERNPMNTTTYGVGEMIRDAISKGSRKFIIGIGGSATNDGGVGMLEALGFEFLDKAGNPVARGARGLSAIVSIRTENKLPELSECSFAVACDVNNPLCGENGCSAVYGPQKGATPEMIKEMDLWLVKFSELTKSIIPEADALAPGAGAAGGMGFALVNFLGAKLEPGIELVMRETGIEKHIKDADLVITGEGRLDSQSVMGKAPTGVARLAKKYGKPVVAFSGCVTEDAVLCNENGIDAFFPIVRKPCSPGEAMNTQNAYNNLKDTACQVFRLIKMKI